LRDAHILRWDATLAAGKAMTGQEINHRLLDV